MSILLMTGTINPAYYDNTCTKLTDVQTRLEQYETALSYYLASTDFTKVV